MSNKNIYPSSKVMSYVYIGVHKVTGHFYIGSRWSNVTKLKCVSSDDLGVNYKTSAPKIQVIFDEFDWTILAEFWDKPNEDIGGSAYDYEQLLIYENMGDKLLLNESCFHNAKARFMNTPKNIKKISETKNKINPLTGLTNAQESEINRSSVMRKVDPITGLTGHQTATAAAVATTMLINPMTGNTFARDTALKGAETMRKVNPETGLTGYQSKRDNPPDFGHKMSSILEKAWANKDSAYHSMDQSGSKNGMFGKTPSNAKPITLDGVLYPSLAAAQRATGLSLKFLKQFYHKYT